MVLHGWWWWCVGREVGGRVFGLAFFAVGAAGCDTVGGHSGVRVRYEGRGSQRRCGYGVPGAVRFSRAAPWQCSCPALAHERRRLLLYAVARLH